MYSVLINKKSAFLAQTVTHVFWTALLSIIVYFALSFLSILKFLPQTIYIVYIIILYGVWKITSDGITLRNLEYFVDVQNSKLVKKSRFLTKSMLSARLQVVNSVDIVQSFWERLFGLFEVSVCYGFGDTGYYFSFNYMSDEEANKVADMIKPSGRPLGRVIEV